MREGTLRHTVAVGIEDKPPKIRLLLVDDEKAVTKALGRFLQLRGYDVETAHSGSEALIQLEQNTFSVMLCDMCMPEMSGAELVSRANALYPDLAIVMLSGVNDAATATEVLARGALGYLTKPVDLTEVERTIATALHRRRLIVQQQNVAKLNG